MLAIFWGGGESSLVSTSWAIEFVASSVRSLPGTMALRTLRLSYLREIILRALKSLGQQEGGFALVYIA
jgi:hypothetical protein